METECRITDAKMVEDFLAISKICAQGWRAAYRDAVPEDFFEQLTDDYWLEYYSRGYTEGNAYGLLMLEDDAPVGFISYGPARISDYAGWGEVISFYVAPNKCSRGYGRKLMDEAIKRLTQMGFPRCYVLVLSENLRARKFYAESGFYHDGTQVDIPFSDRVCVDLRYVRKLGNEEDNCSRFA